MSTWLWVLMVVLWVPVIAWYGAFIFGCTLLLRDLKEKDKSTKEGRSV